MERISNSQTECGLQPTDSPDLIEQPPYLPCPLSRALPDAQCFAVGSGTSPHGRARNSAIIAGAGHQLRQKNESEQLVAVLRERGGGIFLRGWRSELDPVGLLVVSFARFCQAAESLGFNDDASGLFGLDRGLGVLKLAEIAPQEAQLVERFRRWVQDTFGSATNMFNTLDKKGHGRLDCTLFVKQCRKYNFDATDEEFSELYGACDVDDAGSITLQDVVFFENNDKERERHSFNTKMCRKDQRQRLMLCWYAEGQTRPPKHRLASRPWHIYQFEQSPAIVSQRRDEWESSMHRRGKHARAKFVQHLRATYGSEVRAWRRAFDPDGTFMVSTADIKKYCRSANLSIDTTALWKALDIDGSEIFELEELCEKPAEILATFQHWAHKKFGSCTNLWSRNEMVSARNAPQQGGNWYSDKKMLLKGFARVLKTLDWPGAHDSETRGILLTSLDLYGCGIISADDLQWLDKWKAPQWLSADPDPAQWAELRTLMLKAYGHPLRAWRCLLDKDDSNSISWTEFRHACKQLGFKGNIGGAWRVLDTDQSGVVTMKEFDSESAEILSSFKKWADKHFGTVERAFSEIDLDGSGTLDYSELKRACSRLKWEGSVRLLFDCLDTDGKREQKGVNAGKRSLSLKELVFLDRWHIGNKADDSHEQGPSTRTSAGMLNDKTPKRSSVPNLLCMLAPPEENLPSELLPTALPSPYVSPSASTMKQPFQATSGYECEERFHRKGCRRSMPIVGAARQAMGAACTQLPPCSPGQLKERSTLSASMPNLATCSFHNTWTERTSCASGSRIEGDNFFNMCRSVSPLECARLLRAYHLSNVR